MSNDELKLLLKSSLTSLLNTRKIIVPLTSMTLLTRVITNKLPSGLLPPNATDATRPVRFKLTDLSLFENILENLARTWDDVRISLSRDRATGEMSIWELALASAPSSSSALAALGSGFSVNPLKRKRVVDEDDDSAAGEDDEDDEAQQVNTTDPPQSTLNVLSKELREVYAILQKSTAKGRLLAEQFHSPIENFEPLCSHITKEECTKARRLALTPTSSQHPVTICDRVHFRPLIRPHTDPSLGHCSYLNTCYSEPTYAQSPSIPPFPGTTHSHGMAPPNTRGPASLPSGLGAGGRGKEKAPCRYLHYEIDWDGGDGDAGAERERKKEKQAKRGHRLEVGLGPTGQISNPLPPQWINCDLRRFDYSVLGKFHVIMADPPWDIHMSLPYGTMTDDEMRAMPIPTLQDEGLLFLWVTGRAMEVGRECLRVWGYTRVDEVAWVKTNQLQRVIRTGRTGHWLNHTKEHMLIGVKSVFSTSSFQSPQEQQRLQFPRWVNRGLDTDVIVSEVRETSRKPDEVYGLIERMCPGGRKIEIFGRRHNTRPGWLTLGNQLGPDRIHEEELAARIKAKYPDRPINVGLL